MATYKKKTFEIGLTTCATIVGVCIDLMAMEVGKHLPSEIVKTQNDCKSNEFLGSALLDMYTKCRSAYDIRNLVFNLIPVHNVVPRTTMILKYGQQRNVE